MRSLKLFLFLLLFFLAACAAEESEEISEIEDSEIEDSEIEETAEQETAEVTVSSGELFWATATSSWPMFRGNYDHSGFADVLGPQKGELKWKYNIGLKKVGEGPAWAPTSVAIGNDGTIYVAGRKMVALDSDGNEKWSIDSVSSGPAVSPDGTAVYFLSGNSVVAVDTDGNEQWKFTAQKAVLFAPTVGPDGTIYQGSWDHYFYAINPDGSLKWKYETAGCISYPSSVGPDGTVYLGGGDAHCGGDPTLYAFDPDDGSLKWSYTTSPGKDERVGPPVVLADRVYAPGGPTLFALDFEGNLLWKKGSMEPGKEPGSIGLSIISPAIGSDGTIYQGNSQGIFYALDPETRAVKWQYQTGPDPNDSDFYGMIMWPVVDKEGTVYVGSVDHFMYAFDKDGNLLWKYKTGGKLPEASSALGADGTLYFTSDDGYLYAIGE